MHPLGTRSQKLVPSSTDFLETFYQRAGSKVEQVGLKLVYIINIGTADKGLIHYIPMPVLPEYFLRGT